MFMETAMHNIGNPTAPYKQANIKSEIIIK